MESFKVKYLIYFTFFCLCAVLTGAGAQDYSPKDVKENFSWNLIKNLFEKETSNVVISPFNVKILFAILAGAAGSGSEVQTELYRALEFTDKSNEVQKEILAALRKADPAATLNLETKIYADEALHPQQKYLDLLANFYGTGYEKILFGDGEASSQAVNSWCESVTNGKLKEFVKPKDLANNALMFASVLYFNGLWSLGFSQATDGVFYPTPDTTRNVQYMHKNGEYYVYSNPASTFDMVRIPYKGKNLSMFVLLPKTKDGIEQITESLTNTGIKEMQSQMSRTTASLTLPKFKFDFETNLKKTFAALSIKKVFRVKTVLLGEELSFARIIQKSGIDVNEQGTEAYDAESAVFVPTSSVGRMPFEFKADHPFVFFIEEETTGSILFAGKVLEPSYE